MDDADEETIRSYEWGLVFWGQEQADLWLRNFYSSVIGRLSEFPYSCPLAPESEYLDQEIRQLQFGRYRILFEIMDDEVTVLRLLGPYTELPDADSIALD